MRYIMKKKTILALIVSILVFITGCGKNVATDSQSILSALSSVPTMGETVIYDASTDPNEILGRPNQYIAKADFADNRCEQYGIYLKGGTFEVFSNKSDCQSRYEYLEKMSDPSLGIFGVNQYIYKYDTVILRVDYSLVSEQAEEYRDALSSYFGKKPTQNY